MYPLNTLCAHTTLRELACVFGQTPTDVGVLARVRVHCASMHLVVLRTFFTLVSDESPAPPRPRAHSAPAALYHADFHAPSSSGGPVPPKPRKKKQAKRVGTTADPDDLVFEEYAPIVAQERAQLPPPELVAQSAGVGTTARRRARGRGGIGHEVMAGHEAPDTGEACVRNFFETARIRLRPNVHEHSDPRPADAIFLFREGLGDVGIEFDARFCTTTLRSWLLGINGYEWDDAYVVATGDTHVPMGSTLGEEGIAAGARLRLVRPALVNIVQS